MNTRKMITNAILIAIGAILHQVTPLLGVPMQPDFALVMLFIIMIYNNDYKTTLICGLIIGIFTALTTKTPGGQIPNILDKFITCNVMYFILIPLRSRISKFIQMIVLLPVGTLVSGVAFITLLMTIVGLPAGQSFQALFIAVVIPAVVINIIMGIILFKIVDKTAATTGAYSA